MAVPQETKVPISVNENNSEGSIGNKKEYETYLNAMASFRVAYDAVKKFVVENPIEHGKYFEGYFTVTPAQEVSFFQGSSVKPFSGSVSYSFESMGVCFRDVKGHLIDKPSIVVDWAGYISFNEGSLNLSFKDDEITPVGFRSKSVLNVTSSGIELEVPVSTDEIGKYKVAEKTFNQEVMRRRSIKEKLIDALSTLVGRSKRKITKPVFPEATKIIDNSLPELTEMVTTATELLKLAYEKVQVMSEDKKIGQPERHVVRLDDIERLMRENSI